MIFEKIIQLYIDTQGVLQIGEDPHSFFAYSFDDPYVEYTNKDLLEFISTIEYDRLDKSYYETPLFYCTMNNSIYINLIQFYRFNNTSPCDAKDKTSILLSKCEIVKSTTKPDYAFANYGNTADIWLCNAIAQGKGDKFGIKIYNIIDGIWNNRYIEPKIDYNVGELITSGFNEKCSINKSISIQNSGYLYTSLSPLFSIMNSNNIFTFNNILSINNLPDFSGGYIYATIDNKFIGYIHRTTSILFLSPETCYHCKLYGSTIRNSIYMNSLDSERYIQSVNIYKEQQDGSICSGSLYLKFNFMETTRGNPYNPTINPIITYNYNSIIDFKNSSGIDITTLVYVFNNELYLDKECTRLAGFLINSDKSKNITVDNNGFKPMHCFKPLGSYKGESTLYGKHIIAIVSPKTYKIIDENKVYIINEPMIYTKSSSNPDLSQYNQYTYDMRSSYNRYGGNSGKLSRERIYNTCFKVEGIETYYQVTKIT